MTNSGTAGRSVLLEWLTPVLAVAVAAALGGLLFTLLGEDGLKITREVFLGPLLNPYKWSDLVLRSSPMILIAAGLVVCYRAGVYNIGAEGQYILGAIGATSVALATQNMSGYWILPLMMVAGVAAGIAWASLPALLLARLRISEVVTTLMLVYVATQVLNFLVATMWRSPTSLGLPSTSYFGASQSLQPIMTGSLLHYGVVISFFAAIVCWFVMKKSVYGFFIRIVGLAPRAARYSGLPSGWIIASTLLVSGATAGLAGAIEVSGSVGKLSLSFPSGHGFSAVVVLFLARLNPLALIPAGLVIALVRVGGEMAQLSTGIPSAAARIFEVLTLVLLLSGEVVTRWIASQVLVIRNSKEAIGQ